MTPKSVEFELVGFDGGDSDPEARGWFRSERWVGLEVIVTVARDGRCTAVQFVDASGPLRWRAFDDSEPERDESCAIGTRDLREIPVQQLVHAVRSEWQRRIKTVLELVNDRRIETPVGRAWSLGELAAHNRALLADLRGSPRPGRRGRDDLFYARLASQYVDAMHRGVRMKDLAAELHLSPQTLRNQISAARDRKPRPLLTRPPRAGVSGGELTPLALELLANTTDDNGGTS